MISGIIAKYAKVVRKSDEHIVALAVDYFHEDAIRCTYLISIEKGKIAPNIGLCAEKNGDRKIDGCSYSEVMEHVLGEMDKKFGKRDYRVDTVDISEKEFVQLVRQSGFAERLLTKIRETTSTRYDTSVFDFASATFQMN